MADSSTPFVNDKILDGKAVAAQIRAEVAATVKLLKEKHGKVRSNAAMISSSTNSSTA
jgi:5,10-methylene-tetrahydrofolate dehydrogenase/methenyl tetrahydrofolate cyclohydrolase